MRPIKITPRVQKDFYAWNADNERARADYEEHPTAACHAEGCFDLMDDDDLFCPKHRGLNILAALRMRKRRAS